jgi:hypothetical protein
MKNIAPFTKNGEMIYPIQKLLFLLVPTFSSVNTREKYMLQESW